MKKRDVILLAILGLLALATVLSLRYRDRPIVHNGRNAWQWAADLESPVPGAREKAATALAEMGTNAVPMLRRQLELRESLARTLRLRLGKLLPGRLGAALLGGVRPLPITETHWVAARALKILGTNAAAATPALLRAMRDDADPQVTWDTAGALGTIGEPAVPGLMDLLKSPNYRVRHAAAFALGQIGPPALPAASALIRRATDANPDVRNAALYALSRIGPTAGTAALKLARDERGELRRAAARALVATHPRGQLTLPVLVEMAADADPASRAVAIESLTSLSLRHTNALAAFTTGLSDSNSAVRLASVKAFAALPQKAGPVAATLEQLQREDADPAVRLAATEALAKISAVNLPPAH